MPVTQRLALLQVAMFDQLPELIELLDRAFQTPASQSTQLLKHIHIIEEHLSSMRRHFKASGLGLMWLGVLRTHCSSANARAVALNEMAARAIKLSVRRRLRSAKVLHHKEGDGTDVAQTPKEDCVLVLSTFNSILQDWDSFCRSTLVLLMTAKFPGCFYEFELKQPDALFSSINPMLCIERVAKLLRIALNADAFRYASRNFAGEAVSHSEMRQTSSLEQYVTDTLKNVAASFTSIGSSADCRLSLLTDDAVASSPIALKSHVPVAICQAVGLLLETRILMLSSAGVMRQQSSESAHSSQMHFFDQVQRARGVCDDAFLDASEQELLSAGAHRQVIKLSPIMRIFCFMHPTPRKQALVHFKKMSAALHGMHNELLFNSPPCVFVMVECLLALSDVATGSSKSFFLRSALEWMESLWKAQEITSIRAIRSIQSRKATISQSSLLKKLKSASSSSMPSEGAVAPKVEFLPLAESTNGVKSSPERVQQSPIPSPNAKKHASNAKAAAAESAKEQDRLAQNIKDAEKVYNRVYSKLYHASVFVSYLCCCCPTAIISKFKGQWSNLIAGFELSYRKFISCVDQGRFGAKEVKRVLWHTMMLLKPLACEYRVLQSCSNPSAHFLLHVFDIFSRFAVTLDNTARAHFDQDFLSSYEPVFQPQVCHIIFTLSLNVTHLKRLFPNCPSVSEATYLLADGSYYQLLHGEMKTLAQEMQDADEKHEVSVVNVLAMLSKKKKSTDPQQRRNDEAMQIVLSRLTQYSVSDDFLSIDLFDVEKRGTSSVAMLIVCLMLQFNMHMQDINMTDARAQSSDKLKGLHSINLKHTSITSDALHCLSTLLQHTNIAYVNCCGATIYGSLPDSFADLLSKVSHLDLQAVKFCDIEDEYILRKLLSVAVAVTHVNLTYIHSVADEELIALANASGTRLISLKLCRSNSLSDLGLCYAASRCSSLQHLHVLGCDNVAGHFIDFAAAYCPALAYFDINFSNMKQECASLLPQLTNNHTARMGMRDVDLIAKLGVLPSLESIDNYLKHHLAADGSKRQIAHNPIGNAPRESSGSSRLKAKSVISALRVAGSTASPGSAPMQTHAVASSSAAAATSAAESLDANAVVKVSVAEANRVFGNLERVNEEALKCIELWMTLLYGPSESNRAWLGRAEFAPSIMNKYDAATDDFLVIKDDDPEIELQFSEMLTDFTQRGIDSEQCLEEVKAVLLKKRIEQKEIMMAERRLVAEMERDRRTLTTRSECGITGTRHYVLAERAFLALSHPVHRYEEIYHMSGRAAQDADAVRRMKLDIEIATRRQVMLDRVRGNKGPGNIEFIPQSIMRVSLTNFGVKFHFCSYQLKPCPQTDALFKSPGDRVALHPVLHVYVHCILYENEKVEASSKVSSFINVSYDRQFRTTPVLERSNFVDVMEARARRREAIPP